MGMIGWSRISLERYWCLGRGSFQPAVESSSCSIAHTVCSKSGGSVQLRIAHVAFATSAIDLAAICAVGSGAESWTSVSEWGQLKLGLSVL
jgi:hypothetical protein